MLLSPVMRSPALFNVTRLTGNATAREVITRQNLAGGGLALVKNRIDATSAILADSANAGKYLKAAETDAQITDANVVNSLTGAGLKLGTDNLVNGSGDATAIFSWLERAGYLDIVPSVGTGVAHTIAHSLGVGPKLILHKDLSQAINWLVYSSEIGNTKYLRLNDSIGEQVGAGKWNNTSPTNAVFTVGADPDANTNGNNYISYLFGELSGFSKFGKYTGNGSTTGPSIDFGFWAKAWFIKDITGTGDWRFYFTDDAGAVYFITLDSAIAQTSGAGDFTRTATGLNITTLNANINQNAHEYIYGAWH